MTALKIKKVRGKTSAPVVLDRGEIMELVYGQLHEINELADHDGQRDGRSADKVHAALMKIAAKSKRCIELIESLPLEDPTWGESLTQETP